MVWRDRLSRGGSSKTPSLRFNGESDASRSKRPFVALFFLVYRVYSRGVREMVPFKIADGTGKFSEPKSPASAMILKRFSRGT